MTIRAVFFDLGDTLWYFPNYPPTDQVRQETVRRISTLLRSWEVEPEGELMFLGRDIRLTTEKALNDAYWGDLISPQGPAITKAVAEDKGLRLTDQQAEELWETWNLGGVFLGRELYPDAPDTLRWCKERGLKVGGVTNRTLGG